MSQFTDMVNLGLAANKKKVQEWSDKPKTWWALDNCDEIFLAAQKIHVAEDVLRSLADARNEKHRIAYLYRHYSKEMRNKSCWPQRSTSITSNLSAQCHLAAIAELLNLIDNYRQKGKP